MLDQANDWILQVEIIYSNTEAHSVSNLKGDISNVGIFTDNAEKTVYEFLEEIEIGLLGWGTSRQRAAQLYNRHLSEDIKSRTLDCSDNFTDIKKWLIKELLILSPNLNHPQTTTNPSIFFILNSVRR